MTPTKEALARSLHDSAHDGQACRWSHGATIRCHDWKRALRAAEALLAGPLAPSPPEGGADEAAGRVAAWLAVAQERSLRDRLTDADDVISSFAHREPRPRQPEFLDLVTDAVLLRSDLQSLLADRERLVAALSAVCSRGVGALVKLLEERDLWQERAFRAFRLAMEPEDGAEVQWGVRCKACTFHVPAADETRARRLLACSNDAHPLEVVVTGPWRPAPESPGGEPS